MTHTSAEDLMTPAHPRGWAHQEIEGDLDIYIESSKSSQPASHKRAQWKAVESNKWS